MLKYRSLAFVLFALFSLFVAACSGPDAETIVCGSLAECPLGQRCNASGECSSAKQDCTGNQACAFDEYCVGGQCRAAACESDAFCEQGNVCVFDNCREGCRPGDSSCAAGERCNEQTFLCEQSGCTPTSCRARLQRCDESQSPAACVFTGACDTDVQCLAYGRQLDNGNDYICNRVSGECVVKPPCASDDDCRIGDICEPTPNGSAKCRTGCRSSEQCRIGELCAHDQGGVCVRGCAGDEECKIEGDPVDYYCRSLQCVPTCQTVDNCAVVGQVCTGTPRFCQGCVDDSQCRSTQFCDFQSGASPDEAASETIGLCKDLPPTCPADDFGDNHSRDRAHLLGTLAFDGTATFCRENTGGDWFAIDVGAGKYVEIELDYDSADGNLDLVLLRSDGQPVVASEYPPGVDNGREVIRYGVDLGSRMLIQVRGAIITANTTYRLRVNVSDPPACTSDDFDPNTITAPAQLAPSTVYRDLQVCGSSADYYRLQVKDNQVVRITAQAPVNLGFINLVLYDADGNQLDQSNSRLGTETLFYRTTQARDLIVEVVVVNGVGNLGYTLEWSQRNNECSDAFEPNDSCEQAAALTVGAHPDLAVCTDADFYAITLLPFQRLTVSATYSPASAAGELDIFLFGPNDCLRLIESGIEQPMTQAGTVSDIISYIAPRGGSFNLMVSLFQGLNVPYTLDVQIAPGPPCVDDYAAGNSSADTAYAISPEGVYDRTEWALSALYICDLAEDWFSIELEDGDVLEWLVTFRHNDGDLDAQLIGPNKTEVLDSGLSETDNEFVSYTVGEGEAGTYYLRVVGKYAVRTDYRVLTTLNEVGTKNPQCPDMFDTNSSRANAVEIEPGVYEPLLVCGSPANDDWFTTFVRAGETLTVELAYSRVNGRIGIQLFEEGDNSARVTSNFDRDTQTVSFTSTRDQFLSYKVYLAPNLRWNTYKMTVELVTPAPCVDDRYAGNHKLDEAQEVLAPGLYTRLRLCDSNNDWFSVDLTAGEKFEAFIRFTHSVADLDLFIWGPDESAAEPLTAAPVPLVSGISTTNNETVPFTPTRTATYFVEVRSKAPARLDYDLLLYRDTNGDGVIEGPEDRNCPDQFENNDTPATARAIIDGKYDDLSICTGDPDHYTIFVPTGATLKVDLAFVHANGNIDFRFYRRGTDNHVAESASSDDNESLSLINNGLGEFYRIHVSAGAGFSDRNYYSMTVKLSYSGTCDDAPQAGLDRTTAEVLASSANQNLILCEGNEHWFTFDLNGGENVRAELELDHRFGHIDIELLDDSIQLVADDTRSTNLKTINHDVATSGTFYLRVFARDGAFVRTSYDLWVALGGLEPSLPFCPDAYERNDQPALAAPLTLLPRAQYTDMIACGPEEDWYRLDGLSAATVYEIATFFEHTVDVDLALEVRNSAGDVLAQVDSQSDDEILSFTTGADGAYFIGVRNNGAGQSQYSLHAYTNAAYQAATCPEDEHEPNDDEFSARSIGNSVPTRLGLGACGDSDFFRWTAPASGTTSVFARFNNARVNLGLSVQNTSLALPATVVFDLGDNTNNNRAGGTFEAIAGSNYLIRIGRTPLPGQTLLSNGPYFLHVTQP
ncbi:MAG: PPC domain-containing protein [Bradymonadaceae bacterium]|nr:PPC domain-containing protein [Lujinxingiaceae bacterium]